MSIAQSYNVYNLYASSEEMAKFYLEVAQWIFFWRGVNTPHQGIVKMHKYFLLLNPRQSQQNLVQNQGADTCLIKLLLKLIYSWKVLQEHMVWSLGLWLECIHVSPSKFLNTFSTSKSLYLDQPQTSKMFMSCNFSLSQFVLNTCRLSHC